MWSSRLIKASIVAALSISFSCAALSYGTTHDVSKKLPKKEAKAQYSFLPTSIEIKNHTVLSVETIIKVYNQAKAGNADAQAELATGYETGSIGNLPNYKQALYWFDKSAKQNNGLALFSLYQLYDRGLGVKRDQKKAIAYAKKGIVLMLKRVNEQPEYNNLYYWRLGEAYFWGVKDGSKWVVKQSFKKAFDYFNHAAKQGDFHSILKVIWMYKNGVGVDRNQQKSFEWSKYLASLDFPAAQYSTGLDYLHGRGTSKNVDAAVEYFDQSALSGYFPAISKLLELDKLGKKTDLNILKKSWFEVYKEMWEKLHSNPNYIGSEPDYI